MHHTDVGSTQSCRLTSNRGVDSTGRGRIVDTLAEGGRRGVAIELSLGRVLAIQTLKHSRSGRSGNLRALVDSVPAQVPRIPFLISCPRWMNPLDAATADVVQRLGVLYGADDRWFKDAAAKS